MCNCGKKRISYSSEKNYVDSPNSGIQNYHTENFKYVGKTALTVTGNKTGNRYRFYRTGDIQAIDSHDISGMMMIPVLSKIG